jgi:hypothetical protein
MKRIFFVMACLLLAAASLSAENSFAFGPMIGHTEDGYQGGPDVSATSVGLGVASYAGGFIGLYATASFSYITSAQVGALPAPPGDYILMVSLDCVFGIGVKLELMQALSLTGGGGLYYGGVFLSPAGMVTPHGSETLGPGAEAMLAYELFDGFSVNVLAGAGYSMMDLAGINAGTYQNGIHVFGGAGIGFSY